MFALRRSTVLADARLGRLPDLRDEVVLRADNPQVERVLAVVRVGAASPDVESRLLAGDDTVDHADSVYREMLNAGDVPDYLKSMYWVGRQIKGGGHTLDVLVAPDYFAVQGKDGRPFRVGKSSQAFAQEVADRYDAIMPSPKLLRDLEGSADVKLGFIPVQKGGGADDSMEAVVKANDRALDALDKAGATDDDYQLKVGYGKSYVVRPNLNGDYLAIYGGRWSAAGGLVQPNSGKAHTTGQIPGTPNYADYSHRITLVSRKAKLDGADVDLRKDVFGSDDPAIWGLVSDEGRFDPVFPNAGGGSKAEFALGGEGVEPGGEVSGGVDTTVSSTTTPTIGGGGLGAGAPTAGIAGGAAQAGLVDRFHGLSAPKKVGVVALVLLVGGGIAWAVL